MALNAWQVLHLDEKLTYKIIGIVGVKRTDCKEELFEMVSKKRVQHFSYWHQ
ncbi:hypothetical protein M5X00_22615 [Paenibacillus alvei]|uniref:hypothetical protein n=1 Tax=Paenibacillus alvei TaxID=44250 RepID=UPI0002FB812F|nr:hypothetical protein [Paenibacillus alvei]MCY9757041.1 hypothetical protein [Paenibacillus alvei]